MSERHYVVTVVGPVPPDLGDKLNRAWADAIIAGRNRRRKEQESSTEEEPEKV